ncbi:hypothetical protein EV191_101439 [Tamaricihabitans halophyticus]|uniref:Right handed beta helix domain-containing protein n=1 Tax=Tamaricihabitans halophyticus TaxID=1262583 RepID=A0A4V2SUY7_9PSEU|nr:right-handed parallel beta-helix repeat-containing protein [Tamaricihabitans halophyticus]TCP56496.1 hypothetical protein EV191_101439 [Tamaricihabitans halophyticus]
MDQPAYSRRGLIWGAGLTAAAGATAGIFAAPAVSGQPLAEPAEPWTYVPPGGSIADSIEKGARAIQLGAGDYPVEEPIVLPHGTQLRGLGHLSQLTAVEEVPAIILVGAAGPAYGVGIVDLAIDCAETAKVGIDLHIVGREGNWYGDNDAVCRLENLWIWGPVNDGVVYRGTDNRSVHSSRVRVRQAGRFGFLIGESESSTASDCWWIACEATTIRQTGESAGFEVRGANHFFQACKAWYCRDYGFRIRGTRNKFTGCEAQDTRLHGWSIEWDMNTFVGCTADTAGMWDVGGEPDSADGFYFADGTGTSIVGCQSFDRGPRGRKEQQRFGFNVPAEMLAQGRLIGHSGWGNTRGLVHER